MTRPRLAYLTGEYPRASDTFIQREVAALRALGHEVLTCSIRTTGAEHLVGPEQREEHARTFKVLEACRPLRVLRAQARWMARPSRYLRALGLAWRTAPKGLRGRLHNLIYFLEAAVLADELRRRGTPVDPAMLSRLSPLGWDRINLTGDYIWSESIDLDADGLMPLLIKPLP